MGVVNHIRLKHKLKIYEKIIDPDTKAILSENGFKFKNEPNLGSAVSYVLIKLHFFDKYHQFVTY